MRFQVRGRNVEVSQDLQEYAEGKLSKLDRHLHDEATRVELELTAERNPSISDSQIAEATIWTKGLVLRAREASTDMRAAIDLVVDKLERQARRYREKRQRKTIARQRRSKEQTGMGLDPAVGQADEAEAVIVKAKQFALKPMSAEEAALQLEAIGHDFFVFRNDDSEEVNVLYRRRDGNYGLIEPIP